MPIVDYQPLSRDHTPTALVDYVVDARKAAAIRFRNLPPDLALSQAFFTSSADRANANAKPIAHIAISWPITEQPSIDDAFAYGEAFLERLGFPNQGALLAAHDDATHRHIHIMLDRVGPDGKVLGQKRLAEDIIDIRDALAREFGYEELGRNVIPTSNKLETAKAFNGRLTFTEFARESLRRTRPTTFQEYDDVLWTELGAERVPDKSGHFIQFHGAAKTYYAKGSAIGFNPRRTKTWGPQPPARDFTLDQIPKDTYDTFLTREESLTPFAKAQPQKRLEFERRRQAGMNVGQLGRFLRTLPSEPGMNDLISDLTSDEQAAIAAHTPIQRTNIIDREAPPMQTTVSADDIIAGLTKEIGIATDFKKQHNAQSHELVDQTIDRLTDIRTAVGTLGPKLTLNVMEVKRSADGTIVADEPLVRDLERIVTLSRETRDNANANANAQTQPPQSPTPQQPAAETRDNNTIGAPLETPVAIRSIGAPTDAPPPTAARQATTLKDLYRSFLETRGASPTRVNAAVNTAQTLINLRRAANQSAMSLNNMDVDRETFVDSLRNLGQFARDAHVSHTMADLYSGQAYIGIDAFANLAATQLKMTTDELAQRVGSRAAVFGLDPQLAGVATLADIQTAHDEDRGTWIYRVKGSDQTFEERVDRRFYFDNKFDVDDQRTLDASLLAAAALHGGRVEIKGDDKFVQAAVRRAVALGIEVTNHRELFKEQVDAERDRQSEALIKREPNHDEPAIAAATAAPLLNNSTGLREDRSQQPDRSVYKVESVITWNNRPWLLLRDVTAEPESERAASYIFGEQPALRNAVKDGIHAGDVIAVEGRDANIAISEHRADPERERREAKANEQHVEQIVREERKRTEQVQTR